MKAMDSSSLRIGAWRVDPALDQISKDGNTVKLERRAMQLLLCLADHAGQVVSVEQLLDEVWTGVVVTPDSVYHAVAALRRTLGDDSHDPTYIANVPRRGYRLVAPVVPWVDAPNVPVANSPSPTVEPAHATLAVPKTGSRRRRFAIGLSIVLVIGLGYVVVDKFWLSKPATAELPATSPTMATTDKSIAVLPFIDLSEKKDQEYFADGMAEDVLNLLAKIPGLMVIGRTSSFQFKGTNQDLRAVGAKLGAAYLVQGSVRRSNDRVRVTAQLIDTRNGANRWSETYDRPVGDALQIQDEIAANIVRALQVNVGADYPQWNRRVKNNEAYDLYLRGRNAYERHGSDGFAKAATFFRQALDLDPTFADAAVALSETYWSQANWGFVPPGVGYEQARRAAESALKLDPTLGRAHAVLGAVHTWYDWDWAAADREFKAALVLQPRDPNVLTFAAFLPLTLGQYDRADQMLRDSLSRDPFFPGGYMVLAWTQIRLGQLAAAEASLRKVLEIDPGYVWAAYYLGIALLVRGDPDAALAAMRGEDPAVQIAGLPIVYWALGRKVEAEVALRKLIAEAANGDAFEIAEVYAYRGERDEAFRWLERAYAQKDSGLYEIKGDPLLTNLLPDPRYKGFLRKMNLPVRDDVAD